MSNFALLVDLGLGASAHVTPFEIAFDLIGMFAAAAIVLIYLFRAIGEIVEAYYDLRQKFASLRRRFEMACVLGNDKDSMAQNRRLYRERAD
jgi:hypothetical protein